VIFATVLLFTISILAAAFLALGFDLLVVPGNVHSRRSLLGGPVVASGYTLLDLSRHREESLFDVLCGFCRSFEEGDSKRVGEFLGLRILYDLLLNEIGLISNQKFVDRLASVSVDLSEPLLHVVEGDFVGDVIDDDDPVSASVIRTGDGTEPLLASSVPNLQLDRFAVDVESSYFKVHTNGADVRVGVGVIGESKEEARFSHSRISNQ